MSGQATHFGEDAVSTTHSRSKATSFGSLVVMGVSYVPKRIGGAAVCGGSSGDGRLRLIVSVTLIDSGWAPMRQSPNPESGLRWILLGSTSRIDFLCLRAERALGSIHGGIAVRIREGLRAPRPAPAGHIHAHASRRALLSQVRPHIHPSIHPCTPQPQAIHRPCPSLVEMSTSPCRRGDPLF